MARRPSLLPPEDTPPCHRDRFQSQTVLYANLELISYTVVDKLLHPSDDHPICKTDIISHAYVLSQVLGEAPRLQRRVKCGPRTRKQVASIARE